MRAVTARDIRHASRREGGAPVHAGRRGSSATAAGPVATAAIRQSCHCIGSQQEEVYLATSAEGRTRRGETRHPA
eukprot:6130460-Ditylum_brightwellii.AAC.1